MHVQDEKLAEVLLEDKNSPACINSQSEKIKVDCDLTIEHRSHLEAAGASDARNWPSIVTPRPKDS
jgi:hypothetical protein